MPSYRWCADCMGSPRVLTLASALAYEQDPIGRATASRNVTVWFARPNLLLLSLTNRPDEEDARFLERVLARHLVPDVAVHSCYVDLRGVQMEHAFFERIMGLAARHRVDLQRRIRHVAVVAATSLERSVALGFLRVSRVRVATATFDTPNGAMRSLGEELGLVHEFATLHTLRQSSLLGLLRDALGTSAGTLEEHAAKLGVAPRTLQRVLTGAGTTFRKELQHVRIECAKHLLATTDLKLLAVAHEAGFSGHTRFAAAFRAATGETPTRWRMIRKSALAPS